MARKRNFGELIQQVMEEPATDLQTTDLQTIEVAKSVSPVVAKQIEADVSTTKQGRKIELQTTGVTESDSLGLPKYQTLDRKETRLRADQIEALNTTTKSLNRKRRGKGERLTDNTLIRVAVDLLLSRSDDLDGVTEEELRQSLGLPE